MVSLSHAVFSLNQLILSAGGGEHPVPHVWSVIPFVVLLLCIAILPLKAHHWFEENKNRAIVAAGCGIPALAYLFFRFDSHHAMYLIQHSGIEYIQFICLLAALYAISGNIYITGNLVGNPMTNAAFFAIGAVLANLIGTTGAAMVLIRPLLRANSERKHSMHVVIFFIFTVCNCGGLLTPLGDPPLFLGFLKGVDFFWTFRLLPQWAFTNTLIIITYFGFEAYYYKKESKESLMADAEDYVPFGIAGKINFLFLGGVIGAVLASKQLLAVGEKIHFIFLRELIMVAMTLLSFKAVDQGPRHSNKFTWGAIQEVAILFAGIFAAMIPALSLLEARGHEMGVTEPWHFFWATGILSSFLDNAPTYLTFMSTAIGYLSPTPGFQEIVATFSGVAVEKARVLALMSDTPIPSLGNLAPAKILAAISCGAVFMGANSYIGNAPNFMVKSIAEGSGLKMPSFFGYMLYSALVLVPIFAIQTYIFFM